MAFLRVIIVKPSKYGADGYVERFRWGFMPNSTLTHIKSMTAPTHLGRSIEIHAFDEYVEGGLRYLSLLQSSEDHPTLLALVGVQSHQFHRALDLSAYALAHGVEHCVIGGPHPMTCDTSMLQGRGVSFALGEAESCWPSILEDAMNGGLRPVYGAGEWPPIAPPVLVPPSRESLRRYVVPMLGIYPARGCPYTCTFCSVIRIAGRQIRSQPIETTILSLRRAKAAGVKLVMFTSDNFNKYPEAPRLLEAMIGERIELPFFVQCDVQVAKDPAFIELLARAGCFHMFIGVESFSRRTLIAAKKAQNHPDRYGDIVRLCREHGIVTHFSNILGFPGDTEADVLQHLKRLRHLRPDVASFYILTPIPGTEQYDEFQDEGLIVEENLDRFDGTCATWRHGEMSSLQLTGLLFRCYEEFYPLREAVAKTLGSLARGGSYRARPAAASVGGYALLSRTAALGKRHPMAGGVGRIRLDRAQDFQALRRARFGLDLVPLPKSLPPFVAKGPELPGRVGGASVMLGR